MLQDASGRISHSMTWAGDAAPLPWARSVAIRSDVLCVSVCVCVRAQIIITRALGGTVFDRPCMRLALASPIRSQLSRLCTAPYAAANRQAVSLS
ncbi:hypothetical protein BST61_g7519 [Cercospora zeina]